MLDKIIDLPVEAWRYKEGLGLNDRPHLGPYAQDVHKSFGLGTDEVIDLMDMSGIGLAGIKSLAKKVERIEHSLGLNDRNGTDRGEGFGFAAANDEEGFGLRAA